MRHTRLLLALMLLTLPLMAQEAATGPAGQTATPSHAATVGQTGESACWLAFWVCTVFLMVATVVMVAALKRDRNWSLAATLSEESDPIVPPASPGGVAPPQAPQGAPPPVPAPQLVGSSSRMIAAFGLMVLAVMILGIGYGIMWSLFTRGELPNLNGIGTYLLGGSALFAPYAFNQIKEAFKL